MEEFEKFTFLGSSPAAGGSKWADRQIFTQNILGEIEVRRAILTPSFFTVDYVVYECSLLEIRLLEIPPFTEIANFSS